MEPAKAELFRLLDENNGFDKVLLTASAEQKLDPHSYTNLAGECGCVYFHLAKFQGVAFGKDIVSSIRRVMALRRHEDLVNGYTNLEIFVWSNKNKLPTWIAEWRAKQTAGVS